MASNEYYRLNIANQRKNNINRLLCDTYNGMRRRTEGRHSPYNNSLYAGVELLSREDFYNWAKPNIQLLELWNNWKITQKRADKPSIDRIDSSKGYVLGNIQWLTVKANAIKSNKLFHERKYNYIKKPGPRFKYAYSSLEERTKIYNENRRAKRNGIKL